MSTTHIDFAPPAKRRREDMESSQQHISRHNSLYFENGNIVLLSLPKDNVVTAFKVYKDFLLLYSPVFEGMLSLPPHPDVETYDGVPLVRLPDEATDLIPFLSAVYHPTDVPSRRDFYVAYDKVESVFKLSKKYQCDALYKCMKDKLLEIWPLDLTAWDCFAKNKRSRKKRERYNSDNEGQDGDSDDPSDDSGEDDDNGGGSDSGNPDMSLGLQGNEPNLASVLPDPCSAIRLAREYDIPQILPAAFYHLLCTLPSAFSDTNPEDGDHWGRSNSPFGHHANFSLLSPHDVMCYIRGTYAIREFSDEFESQLGAHLAECVESENACTTYEECYGALESMAKEHMDDAILRGDMLEILRGLGSWDDNYDSACEDCLQLYNDFVGHMRSHIWESLPKVFGL